MGYCARLWTTGENKCLQTEEERYHSAKLLLQTPKKTMDSSFLLTLALLFPIQVVGGLTTDTLHIRGRCSHTLGALTSSSTGWQNTKISFKFTRSLTHFKIWRSRISNLRHLQFITGRSWVLMSQNKFCAIDRQWVSFVCALWICTVAEIRTKF